MGKEESGAETQSPKRPKRPKVRIPRAKTPHPCRVCTHPVVADSPDTALHPDCRIDAPRCTQCGRNPAIPDPHCNACAGTGTLAASACPWCTPGPCPICAIKPIIAAIRREHDQANHVGPCPTCSVYAALPFGPFCIDCHNTADAHRRLWEATA